LITLALALAAGASTAAQARQARIMPPAQASCDRNQLTSWFGHVVGYRRSAKEIWLRIATDYGTTEELTLAHTGQANAATHFLLHGAPFTAKDWSVIERKPGVLAKGVRATAWICRDGKTAPLIDWNGAAE